MKFPPTAQLLITSPYPPGVTSLDNIVSPGDASSVVDRWWFIEAPDEDALMVDVTFSYLNSEQHVIGCVACTNAKRHDGSMWEAGFQDPTPIWVDTPTFHQLTINDISTFSPWGISTINEPLPVDLIHFEAVLNEKMQTDLLWTTASEQNSMSFEIQRCDDRFNFEKIGEVPAIGNSNSIYNYYSLDEQPLPGMNYYRLKQIDFDGSFSYSNIESVELKDNSIQIHQDVFGLSIVSERPLQFRLFDLSGKLLAAEFGQNVNFNSFSRGIYLLEVSDQFGIIEQRKLLF